MISAHPAAASPVRGRRAVARRRTTNTPIHPGPEERVRGWAICRGSGGPARRGAGPASSGQSGSIFSSAAWQPEGKLLPVAGQVTQVAFPRWPFSAFAFGDSPALANELAALVQAGRKTATASLPIEFVSEGLRLPAPGDLSIVTLADGAPVAIIELVEVRQIPFLRVDAAFAADEGEGDGSLRSWRTAHQAYFGRVCAPLGAEFEETTLVLCQRFRLVWTPEQPGR